MSIEIDGVQYPWPLGASGVETRYAEGVGNYLLVSYIDTGFYWHFLDGEGGYRKVVRANELRWKRAPTLKEAGLR